MRSRSIFCQSQSIFCRSRSIFCRSRSIFCRFFCWFFVGLGRTFVHLGWTFVNLGRLFVDLRGTFVDLGLISPCGQWSIFWPEILIHAPVRKSGKGLFLPCFCGICQLRVLAASENCYKKILRKYSAPCKLFWNVDIKLIVI